MRRCTGAFELPPPAESFPEIAKLGGLPFRDGAFMRDVLKLRLALAGGILIVASGLVSIVVGGRAGYLFYEPDPGGLFGHVGILAGGAAILIGAVLCWIACHKPERPLVKLAKGLLTVVLGHLGAITGALLVGTAGVLLCYVAGIWLIVEALREWLRQRRMPV
jgi:hypothetical protein